MGEAGENLYDAGNGIGPILEGGQLTYLEHGCTSIPHELGQEYGSKVTRLDLSFNCIRTVDALEKFTNLEELVLDNNDIDDSVTFSRMPKLHTLLINKNKITNVDLFTDKLKASFPALSYLSMLGNQACPNELLASDKDEQDYQRYRYFVIYKLPKLRFLDSGPVKESERAEANRVGALMRVVKADETDLGLTASSDSTTDKYNPLPTNTKDGGQHQVAPKHALLRKTKSTAPDSSDGDNDKERSSSTHTSKSKYLTPPKHSLLRKTLSAGSGVDSSDGEHSMNSDSEEERTGFSTFGRCRYVYYGRHSEGNRFIKNTDL